MRKPSGKHAAYACCSTWLEHIYPKSVTVVRTWEEAKALCSGVPAPPNCSSLVYGISEFTTECAIAKAHEVSWHAHVFEVETITPPMVHILSKETMDSYASEIILRRNLARDAAGETAPRRSDRKRKLGEDTGDETSDIADVYGNEAAPLANLGLGVDGLDGGAPPPGEDGEVPPAPAADLTSAFNSTLAGGGSAPDDSANQIVAIQNQIQQMQVLLSSLVSENRDLLNAVFDPTALSLYNVPQKHGESPPDFKRRIEMIFTALGFEDQVPMISGVYADGLFKSIIRFRDVTAAQFILANTERFHVSHWSDQPGTVAKMIGLKDQCSDIAKRNSFKPNRKGFIFITRTKRSESRGGGAPAAASKPRAPRAHSEWC